MSVSEIDAAVAGFLGELNKPQAPLPGSSPIPSPISSNAAEDIRQELVSAVVAAIDEVLRRRGLL